LLYVAVLLVLIMVAERPGTLGDLTASSKDDIEDPAGIIMGLTDLMCSCGAGKMAEF
jgi:hypothetical protein